MSLLEFPGSRWWKVDLHAHTPHSFDFGGLEGSDAQEARGVSLEDWLLQYMRAEVDGVAVTDHNSHEAIAPLRLELDRLRAESHPDFRELVLFPGIEVTVNDGYHLLGIFDPSTAPEDINGILHNARYSGSRGASNATTDFSLIQVASLIVGAGGLAVPAHADGPRGAYQMDARSLSELAVAGHVMAVELIGDTHIAEAAASKWTPVLGSDAHHLDATEAGDLEDPKFPGSHFTWVKAETLNLEGLALAIKDPPFAVIRSKDELSNLNVPSHTRILELALRHRGAQMELPLSPWLNSVIGGRGVGKSTVLEVLRLAFQRFGELPESLLAEHKWFSPTPEVGKRFWDETTTVDIRIAKDSQEYRIHWAGAAPAVSTIEKRDGEAWVHEPGNVSERFPVLMYSQKQIYETAKDTQSLLSVIDAQPAVRHAEWLAQRDQLHSRYAEARQKIAANDARIADGTRVRGEIADATVRLASLAELRDSGVAAELDELTAVARVQEAAADSVDSFVVALHASTLALRGSLDHAREASPSVHEQALYVAADAAVVQVTTIAETLTSAAALVAEDLARTSKIDDLRSRVFGEADDDDLALTSLESTNTDYEEVAARLAILERELLAIDQASAQASVLEGEARVILGEVRAHRAELTVRRKEFIGSLGLESTSLRLDLFEMGDRSNVETDLRNVLQISTSFDRFFSGNDGINVLLSTPPMNPTSIGDIDRVREFLMSIRREGSTSALLASSGVAVEARMHSRLAAPDAVTVETAIALWSPEDLLRVRYRPDGEQNLRALEQGSPGEKTATLLSLILRMSNDPLILDQPEDDLDNELITDLVVETLKRTKSKRQVLVVTHNANVVVNADSEQVFVLKFGTVPVVDAVGSIQDPLVRAAICKIMEGGERAFTARYRRLVGIESPMAE